MASDFPQLVVVSGPEEGLEYTLPTQGFMRVGRGDDNDLVLSDNSVSRHHLKILLQNNLYFLSDSGSSNGTLLEGRKLKEGQEMPLTHLDEIQIGIYTLRFLQKPFDENEALGKKKQSKMREKYTEQPSLTTIKESDVVPIDVPSEAVSPDAPSGPPSPNLLAVWQNFSRRQKIMGAAGVAVLLALILGAVLWMTLDSDRRESAIIPWNEQDFEQNQNAEKKNRNRFARTGKAAS